MGNLILWPRRHEGSDLALVDLILFDSPSFPPLSDPKCLHVISPLVIPQAIMSKLSAVLEQLPDGSSREMNFYDSSFFKKAGKRLPTPSQVKALSKDAHTSPRPKPVIFKDSEVFVKFGPYVTTAEAQCLWMIKRAFGEEVPVPEIFGWRVDEENHVFLYMELIQGRTLLDRWNELTDLDKNSLCTQLSQITQTLRRLEQDPRQYIGKS